MTTSGKWLYIPIILTTFPLLVIGCYPGTRVENQPASNQAAPSAGAAAVSNPGIPFRKEGSVDATSPRIFQLSQKVKALAAGSQVEIYTGTPWHGRQISVYYIPNTNLMHDVNGYYLRSTANLKRVGMTRIREDGTWSMVWYVGHERAIPKREMFLLARSDNGEYAITQVQHFVHHRY